MPNNPLRRWLTICCLAFITTACGGGGGSGGSNSGSSSGTSSSAAPSQSPSTSSPTPSTPSTGTSYSINLSWTRPTTRTDGSPLSADAIAAYRLFYTRDGSAASEDTVVVIDNGSATSTALTLAVAGTYTFSITAIDSNGSESALSNAASVTLN